LRLLWEDRALSELATAAEWSVPQARAVVEAMERMADRGYSLGRNTGRSGVRYWPVPPLGVFYAVAGDELRVLQVVDARRLRESP
jgi:hypothetical protein